MVTQTVGFFKKWVVKNIAILFFRQQNNKILIVFPYTEILLLILLIADFRAGEYTLSYAKIYCLNLCKVLQAKS